MSGRRIVVGAALFVVAAAGTAAGQQHGEGASKPAAAAAAPSAATAAPAAATGAPAAAPAAEPPPTLKSALERIDKVSSSAAGHRWQALDYAEGLVRVGVQSAVERPEAAALIRKLLAERNLPGPPEGRNILSICVVALCDGSQE